MISEQVKWMVKENDAYNKERKRMEPLWFFLRLNQIDTYNYGMGSVDVANQLRVFYRLNHWLSNRKWWWSILFWVISVILTNFYVLYTKMCDKDKVSKQNR
jgi:preprotein translocase subunit SecY